MAMTGTGDEYQIVTLQRAEEAADLWPAIEAAQYGHIVQRDEDEEAPGQPDPMRAFLDAFSEVIEAWDEAGPEVQAALIQKLEPTLAALGDSGRQVHWGTVARSLVPPDGEPVEIPLAILCVGSRREPSLEIALPAELTAEDADADDDPGAG